jgi:hypothetical protein
MAAILERSLVAKKFLKQQIEAAATLASVYAAVEALAAAMQLRHQRYSSNSSSASRSSSSNSCSLLFISPGPIAPIGT